MKNRDRIQLKRFFSRDRMRQTVRRFAVMLVIAAILIGYLPAMYVWAAEDGGSGSSSESVSWKAFGTGNSGKAVTEGQTVSHLYMMEISTGIVNNDKLDENILFFNIHYTTTDGRKGQKVIVPGEDGITNGIETAATVGMRTARDRMVTETFGLMKTPSFMTPKALQSVSTDQYLFEIPDDEIASLDKFQIFGTKNDNGSTWPCQALRIYKVDKLYGLDNYGWYSNTPYIDFEGEMIGEFGMVPGGGNFKWDNSGGMHNVEPVKAGSTDRGGLVTLVTTSTKATYEANSGRKSNVGTKHVSQAQEMTSIRLDLADQNGAGFESMAINYEAGSKPKNRDLSFAEAATLTIRYTDLYDAAREVKLPMMANAFGAAAELLGEDISVAGYAQQGDSIMVPVMLPDFKSLISTSIMIGHSEMLDATGLSEGSSSPTFMTRCALSESDDISYLGVAVYNPDAVIKAALNGATIVYDYPKDDVNPVRFGAATSIDGTKVRAQTETYFYLQSHSDNMVLKPVDRQERYLVTVYTDNVMNAGTTSDVSIRFTYNNLKDKEIITNEMPIRDYVRQFYGEWPGNVSDFAYNYGLSQGGKVQFMVPLTNVKQFTQVALKVNGNDEWQTRGLTIQLVKSYDYRVASWEETNSTEKDVANPTLPRFMSHVKYTRNVVAGKVIYECGEIANSGIPDPSDPDPATDEDWLPGTLIQEADEWTRMGGTGMDISKEDDVNWHDYMNYMTYEDTKKNFGFTKPRYLYTVNVYVADKVNYLQDGFDDDCGSENLFYFQLIFENGASGCTLANQQIVGDAFRTGSHTSFQIPMSIDYGDLTAIQVIPDDQDSNSHIYDKMKIDHITVTLESSSSKVPTWNFMGSDEDGLGWVGIEYRDEGEGGAFRPSEGRSVSEIATNYQVTSRSYSAKLLVSITTGPYSKEVHYDDNLNPYYVEVPQLVGGVTAKLNFLTDKGNADSTESVDIIQLMNQYTGRNGTKVRTYLDNNVSVTEDVNYYVSDPAYQFRAGKTDNFIVTVSDISEILGMDLLVYSSVVTKWNISDVSVYLVQSEGQRYLDANGVYSIRYPKGEDKELKKIANWNRNGEALIKDLQIYRTLDQNSIADIKIQFEDGSIELDDEETQAISREPASKNDTVNLYIYPGEDGDDPSTYYLHAAIRYIDAVNKSVQQVSAEQLYRTYDENGRVVFYALGINVPNLQEIQAVDVSTNSKTRLRAPIDGGLLQRVRSGILIESYELGGAANADNKNTTLALRSGTGSSTMQRVLMQVSDSVTRQVLTAGQTDLALAVYFRTSDVTEQELRSKYIYLTDMGYTEINPGQILEFNFDVGNIEEITGLNVVTMGKLDMAVENAYIATQDGDGKVQHVYSIENGFQPGRTPTRVYTYGDVNLLQLNLKTAMDELSLASGTNTPIRMTVGYYDQYGAFQTKPYNDIRNYVETVLTGREGAKLFEAGSTELLRLLIPGLREVRWIELEPYSETTGETLASWKLESASAQIGLDGRTVSRTVGKRIVQNSPETIFLADLYITGEVTLDTGTPEVIVKDSEGKVIKGAGNTVSQEQEGTLTINSGETVTVDVRTYGTDDGFEAKLYLVDAVTGVEEPVDAAKPTHSYTDQQLTQMLQSALVSASSGATSAEEVEAAKALITRLQDMQSSNGSYTVSEDDVVFRPSKNYKTDKMNYRIRVSAVENPDAAFEVNVIVRPVEESVDIEKVIDDWSDTRTVATMNVMDASGAVVENNAVIRNAEERGVLLSSGGSVTITTTESVNAVFTNYDAATGTAGAAGDVKEFGLYNYTADQLQQYLAQAQTVLADTTATADELTAASAVQNAVNLLQSSYGAHYTMPEGGEFNAPRNFTGQNVSYRFVFTSEATGKELCKVIVTVQSEADPLSTALSDLQAAQAARKAAEEAAAEEAAKQQQNQDTGGGDTTGDSGDDTSGGGS